MPLNITVDINGTCIRRIRATNLGASNQDVDDLCRYRIETGDKTIGIITHKPSDGAVELAYKACGFVVTLETLEATDDYSATGNKKPR